MPPHKSVPVDSPSPEMRLEMARLAFENVDRAQVSDMEVARRGVSYTIDTLTELRRENPEDELDCQVPLQLIIKSKKSRRPEGRAYDNQGDGKAVRNEPGKHPVL